jgi:hypothetical protein
MNPITKDNNMSNPITIPEGTILANLNLVGVDANALVIVGTVAKALRRAGNPPAIVDAFRTQATSGDYDHVLAVALAFTTTDDEA